MTRLHALFGGLILAQAAHSVEEYVGRLYESFPPARFVSGLVSANLERGFLVANVAIVAAGVWCFAFPVLRGWPSARAIIATWTVVELVNGVGHPLWSVFEGGYTPGVGTAPVLFILAVLLVRELRTSRDG